MRYSVNYLCFVSTVAGCVTIIPLIISWLPEIAMITLICFLNAAALADQGYREGVSSGIKAAVWRFLSLPLAGLAFWASWAFSRRGNGWYALLEAGMGLMFLFVVVGGKNFKKFPGELAELRRWFKEYREWKKVMRRPK